MANIKVANYKYGMIENYSIKHNINPNLMVCVMPNELTLFINGMNVFEKHDTVGDFELDISFFSPNDRIKLIIDGFKITILSEGVEIFSKNDIGDNYILYIN